MVPFPPGENIQYNKKQLSSSLNFKALGWWFLSKSTQKRGCIANPRLSKQLVLVLFPFSLEGSLLLGRFPFSLEGQVPIHPLSSQVLTAEFFHRFSVGLLIFSISRWGPNFKQKEVESSTSKLHRSSNLSLPLMTRSYAVTHPVLAKNTERKAWWWPLNSHDFWGAGNFAADV